MRAAEETYLKLAGPEGHAKAEKTFEVILIHETNPHVLEGARHIYYLTLLNAYYRGQNAGVERARVALREAKAKNA